MRETRRQRLFRNAMANAAVATRSYQWGWQIDQERQQKIAEEIELGIFRADATLQKLLADPAIPAAFAGKFNANSPPQVATLFYEILGLPIRFRTPSGRPGAGKDALQTIAESGEGLAKELAVTLRDRKQFAKLKEAYIDNLRNVSVVRPAAHVAAQIAGRWSYKAPALQTTPPRIKPMFVARDGNWMVSCDLAGAELRTMAVQSGDQGMITAFNEGKDLHALTAQIAFGVSPEEAKTKQYRNPAKVIGLGTHYSVLDQEGAAMGLHNQLVARVPGIRYETVLGAVRRLEEGRPGVFDFKRATLAQAHERDYVEEPLLRRRRYFYGKAKDTEAYNFAQQAMVAAIVDRAVQAIDAELDHDREGLLLQRHDELILEGPDPRRLCDLLWQHLRQTHTVRGNTITFEIDYWIGTRWGEGGAALEPKNGQWVCSPRDGREGKTFTTLDKAVAYAVAV